MNTPTYNHKHHKNHPYPHRQKTTANILANICATLTAYSFFGNKPEARQIHIEECKGNRNLF